MIRVIPLVFAIFCMWLIPATRVEAQTESGQGAQVDKAAKDESGKSATSPATKAPKKPQGKEIRMLDEITIEGEIEIPQVLFITARDRDRYHDHLHRMYLWSSTDLARETVFPMRLGTWLLPE